MHYLPAYINYFATHARYAILFGGAGSGKSVTAAQKVILQCLLHPGASILCIRKYRTSLRHSVFELLKSQLQNSGRAHQVIASVTNLTFQFQNRSQIRCLGLDDPEKIKSIQGITSVWVEEATELREEDFAQLELRVRGKTAGYKQFTLSFNPIDQSHWLHKRFFQNTPTHNASIQIGAPFSPVAGVGGWADEGVSPHSRSPREPLIRRCAPPSPSRGEGKTTHGQTVFRSADASRANASMRFQSPASIASCGITHDPPTQMTFGSAR